MSCAAVVSPKIAVVENTAGECMTGEPQHYFEGPEKKLEMDFVARAGATAASERGMRAIARADLDALLELAHCTIVSKQSNEHFDAYVLSESSLFVYPGKVILKTCGTTTLLKCVPRLLELAKSVDMQPDFVYYTRKNFSQPERQLFPHDSFQNETDFLQSLFKCGSAYVLGPLTADHWFLYFADFTANAAISASSSLLLAPPSATRIGAGASRALSSTALPTLADADQTLEIMMSELDPAVMRLFQKEALGADYVSAVSTTDKSGIAALVPGSVVDPLMFDPCGYSVNGLNEAAYYTIHITPEAHCSYVSFETNLRTSNYSKLVNRVIELFKPGRFAVTVFADSGAAVGTSTHAFEPVIPGYDSSDHCHHHLKGGYTVSFSTYARVPAA